ncbi:MAG TPA: TetR/AcrR family transcriptional regulator [Acidimicrobiia bacterium]
MTATDDLNAVIDLLWTPPPPPRRGPKPGLTLNAIAEAGIAVADTDGLGAVTMQRVAEALGVTKMALYRYVRSKTELVALMTELALSESIDPEADPETVTVTGGWRSKLDAWAWATLDHFIRHPWVRETTTGPRAMGPNELGWVEQALVAMSDIELTGAERLDVATTLAGHARAVAQQHTARTGGGPEEAINDMFALLVRGREKQFPALAAALASAAEPGARNQAFAFGLARILDGIELLVDGRS